MPAQNFSGRRHLGPCMRAILGTATKGDPVPVAYWAWQLEVAGPHFVPADERSLDGTAPQQSTTSPMSGASARTGAHQRAGLGQKLAAALTLTGAVLGPATAAEPAEPKSKAAHKTPSPNPKTDLPAAKEAYEEALRAFNLGHCKSSPPRGYKDLGGEPARVSCPISGHSVRWDTCALASPLPRERYPMATGPFPKARTLRYRSSVPRCQVGLRCGATLELEEADDSWGKASALRVGRIRRGAKSLAAPLDS